MRNKTGPEEERDELHELVYAWVSDWSDDDHGIQMFKFNCTRKEGNKKEWDCAELETRSEITMLEGGNRNTVGKREQGQESGVDRDRTTISVLVQGYKATF